MRRLVGIVIVALLVPAVTVGGPIMKSAERLAARIQPAQSIPVQRTFTPVPCSEASTREGEEAADSDTSPVSWFFAGMLGPVATPLVVRTTTPQPRIEDLQNRMPEIVQAVAARELAPGVSFRDAGGTTAAAVVGAAAAEEIRCFQMGYAEKSRDKKGFWSWLGSAGNVVLASVLTWALNREKDENGTP